MQKPKNGLHSNHIQCLVLQKWNFLQMVILQNFHDLQKQNRFAFQIPTTHLCNPSNYVKIDFTLSIFIASELQGYLIMYICSIEKKNNQISIVRWFCKLINLFIENISYDLFIRFKYHMRVINILLWIYFKLYFHEFSIDPVFVNNVSQMIVSWNYVNNPLRKNLVFTSVSH